LWHWDSLERYSSAVSASRQLGFWARGLLKGCWASDSTWGSRGSHERAFEPSSQCLRRNEKNRLMRVAMITNFCPPYRRPLFLELNRRLDLTVLFTTRGTEWFELGERPTSVEGLRSINRPSAAGVYRELAAGNYDAIIVSLTGRATLLATFGAATVKRLPLVLWVGIWQHPSTFAHRMSRPIAKQLYRSADAILAYGSHVADYLRHEAGRTHDVFLAAQAVDNERFRAPVGPERIDAFRTRLALGDNPTIAFVGRLEEDKGIGDLLQASAGIELPHQVVIAGRGSLSATLREQATALGLDRRVRFVGHLGGAELLDMFHASDLLVLPSCSNRHSRECWGMVVNEAMNCGLPVVATDAVGAAAGGLVLNEQTGLIVPQRTPHALAAALGDLIGNEAKCRRLGEAARKHVLNWTHASAAEAFEAALAAAREGRHRRARPTRP
jgi:glycosyltransferase involved in cell wall biosynthesis